MQHMSALADLGEESLNSYFSQIERALHLLGRDLSDKGGELDARRARFLLKRFNEAYAQMQNVTLIRPDGQMLISAQSFPHAVLPSVASEPSFMQARDALLKGGTLSISRPMIGLVVKQWVVPIHYGVRDDNGNLVFVITAVMPVSVLQNLWRGALHVEGRVVSLRRDDDYVVSHFPDPDDKDLGDVYGKPMNGVLSRRLHQAPGSESGLIEENGGMLVPERLLVFRRLPSYPLTFVVMTPLSNVRAQWWRNVRFTYLLLLALAVGTYIIHYRVRGRQAALETEQMAAHARELAREKALRNTLVREVHHRVKNALQGAILMIDNFRSAHPEFADAMAPAVVRLQSMATVFGLQAADGGRQIMLCKLVAEICVLLAKAMGCSVDPVIKNELVRPVQIAENEGVPVALIINELVLNAIKHGRPDDPVQVLLSGDGASASVRIVAAGAALPPGFDFNSGAGLGTGLQLVKSMLTKEGTTVEITSGPEGASTELVLRPPVISYHGVAI